jgi:glycosyltransferase involved in cell wall biosynthesis
VKVGYACEPQIGGTYSFFRRIRPALAGHGIDLRCLPPVSGERFAGTRFSDEEGVDYVRFPEYDLPEASRQLSGYLEEQGYEALLVLPGCDRVWVNLVRYLPRTIHTAARVPMITRGTYAPARGIAPYLNRVFAVSDRVADDLAGSYGLPRDLITVAYNGVTLPEPTAPRRDGGPLVVLYNGRLSDTDKGVLLLPAIMQILIRRGIDVVLRVAGAGPDGPALAEAVARLGLGPRVQLLGNRPLADAEAGLAAADVFLLPSRFEGCPNALLEAMAAGKACVAARIRGSVDRIVSDGVDGLLAEVADPASFAAQITRLAVDTPLRTRLGESARQTIAERFTVERTASIYARDLLAMRSFSDRRPPPLDLKDYQLPAELLPTWRTRIPAPLKNFARKWMERLGVSA